MKIKIFKDNRYYIDTGKYISRKINNLNRIIICSGETVFGIEKYFKLNTKEDKNFILSDERIVSKNSKNLNFNKVKKLKIFRKKNFNLINFPVDLLNNKKEINKFIKTLQNDIADLAILTIGDNCHVASIFFDQLRSRNQVFFKSHFSRVSLPVNFLAKSKKIFFLCKKTNHCKALRINFKKNIGLFKHFPLSKSTFIFSKSFYQKFKII